MSYSSLVLIPMQFHLNSGIVYALLFFELPLLFLNSYLRDSILNHSKTLTEFLI